MQRLFSFLISILTVGSMLSAKDRATDPEKYYLTENEVANSLRIIPAMPDTTSARFAYDREMYEWGKSVRGTARGRQAVQDADVTGEWLDRVFGESMGISLTRENAPEIWKLINNMKEDAGDLATRAAKKYYQRPRPFMFFNEPSGIPEKEDKYRSNGSYPSGHTALGWATALVLTEIAPERASDILERGYEFGQSRVIVGYHFQSDVDMGRVVGSGVIGILHDNDDFNIQLQKAKKEYRSLLAGTKCK